MTTIYERLRALQINLPELPPPVVDGYVPSFVPFVRAGNLIYLSGPLAKKDGKPFSGKLEQQITTAEGRQAARDVAIEILATLQAALGDLKQGEAYRQDDSTREERSRLHRIPPGRRWRLRTSSRSLWRGGVHARTSHGGAEIPFGSCVEIEMIVEVSHSDSECQV
jgi:enamine deaminase RidA (YjgF/YER057c/UK114 family)